MRYPTLLFDLDGTLFDFDRGEAIAIADTFRHFSLPVTDANIGLYHHINNRYWKMYERGEVGRHDLSPARFRDLLRELGSDADAKEVALYYELALAAQHHPYLGSLSVVKSLREQGHTLHIVTNGFARTQHGRLASSPLTPFFSEIFISEEMGAQKPSPTFFDLVFARIGVPRKDALIIGDSLSSDILGGMNAGIDSCWFNRTGQPNTTKTVRPTYVIRKLEEIFDIVK